MNHLSFAAGLSVRYDASLKETTIEISDVHEGSILVIIVRRSTHDQEPWARVTTKRAEAHKTRWSCAVTTVAPYSREHSAFIPSGVKEYEKVAEFFVVDTAEGGALPFAYHFIAGNEWL
jgi:poly-beta-hydroxyalkanoate depolymerase